MKFVPASETVEDNCSTLNTVWFPQRDAIYLRLTNRLLASNKPTAPMASDVRLAGSGTAFRNPLISPPGKVELWMLK
jgi:hypothetical protein